jgi:hypothetical protein
MGLIILIILNVVFLVILRQYMHQNYVKDIRKFRENTVLNLDENLSIRLGGLKALSEQQANPNLNSHKLKSLNKSVMELTESTMLLNSSYLWSYHPENNTLGKLLAKLNDFRDTPILKTLTLQMTVTVPQGKLRKEVAPQYAALLLHTFQELLLNMVKHTESAQIQVQIQLTNNQLDIRIQNAFALVPPTKLPPLPTDPSIREIFGIQKRSKEFQALGGDLQFSEDLEGQICQMNIPLR